MSAVIGGGLGSHPGIRSGTRVGLPTQGAFLSNVAVAADTMYAYPIIVPDGFLCSAVEIQVGTAVSASGKLGIAKSGIDGRPYELIAEAPTAVDMNSTAATILQAVLSRSVFVPSGVVWVLSVFDGAAQPYTIGNFNSAAILPGHLIGPTTLTNYTLAGATGCAHRCSRAQTYSAAFPPLLTGWATANTNPSSPVGCLVAA